MKKVCMLMNADPFKICSGVGRFVMDLALPLSESFQVAVVGTRSTDGLKIKKINSHLTVYQFPDWRLPIPDIYLPRFSRELKEVMTQSDLFFLHTLDLLYPFYLIRRLQKPLVMYLHGLDWERIGHWGKGGRLAKPIIQAYCAWMYNHADHLCLPSVELRSVMAQTGIRVPSSKIAPGIDINRFYPAENPMQVRRGLGLETDTLIMGYVGRIFREKNIDLLIEVFLKLYQKNSKLRLLLVGGGFPHYEKQLLKDHPGLILAGQQNDVVPYLQAMDVFCMPSHTETSSLATLEAMACGVPAVANDIGCIGEYLKSGENGFLIDPPSNEEGFAQAVDQILSDIVLRKNLGRNAHETIRKRFDWKQTALEFKSLFEGLLE